MASKAIIYKFEKIDKRMVRGKKHHTRTGACTCRRTEKCQHGKNYSAPKI